jgi:hypothetical protein
MFGRKKTTAHHKTKDASTTSGHDQSLNEDTVSMNIPASTLSVEEQPQSEPVAQAPPEGGLLAWLAGKSTPISAQNHGDVNPHTQIVLAFFLAIMNTW